MDVYSLVGSHLSPSQRRSTMDAGAEEQYYRTQVTPPRLRLRPLVEVASFVALIILVAGAAYA